MLCPHLPVSVSKFQVKRPSSLDPPSLRYSTGGSTVKASILDDQNSNNPQEIPRS